MRYALISDIHANLPALEAVLAHIEQLGNVDSVFHLGDLVGYAPWPNEVVSLLRARAITGIAGNYDSTVGTNYKHCGCRYEDPRQEELSHVSFGWTKNHCSDETRHFLAALPFRMDVKPLGGHAAGPTIILVHGTPTLNTLYWTEDRPDTFCTQMANIAGAKPGDMLCFGHTHMPWARTIEGIHFVNTGSVGRPKDGNSQAGYTLVTVDADAAFDVQHIRVPYDVRRAAAAIRESDLPDSFASYLESGGKHLDPEPNIR